MTILALDLGTNTGWAKQTFLGDIVSGTESFATKRHEGAGMKYLRFKRWLTEIKQSGIEEVYYEEVRNHAGVAAAHAYGGYEAHLMAKRSTGIRSMRRRGPSQRAGAANSLISAMV